jgi:hypothetical protein
MLAAEQQTDQTVALTMLQGIAEAIGGRPGDTMAQRDNRSRDVLHSVLGFRPRDPVEIMLAGMTVAHVYLIQDSACDALRDETDVAKARTKSTIVALDRMLFGFLKELRTAQTRSIEGWADAEKSPTNVADAQEHAPAEAELPKTPTARQAPPTSPVRVASPPPPLALFPLGGRTETSIGAMMSVLSPPDTPDLGPFAAVKPAVPASRRGPAQSVAPYPETGTPERDLDRLTPELKVVAAFVRTTPKGRGAVEYFAPAASARGSLKAADGGAR